MPPTPIAGVVGPWIETTNVGLGHITDLWATERSGVYVLSGQPAADTWAGQLWYSEDGMHWRRATMPAERHIDRIHAIAIASYSGSFVALGLDIDDETFTHVLISADGRDWQFAGSFKGIGTYLADIDGRLLAFGNLSWPSDPWYSENGGATWQRLETASGMAVANGLLAIHRANGYLWAVRSDDPIEDASIRTPVELWRTSDGLEWHLVRELPQSISANKAAMAHGPTGWVITAGRYTFPEDYEQSRDWYAWYSSDGETWKAARSSPAYVEQIVVDEQGFIGVGRDPGPCCALSESNVRQHVWTSADGSTWRRLSRKGWHGREIDFITSVGYQVVGVGMDWLLAPGPDGEAWGVVWEVERSKLLP